MSGLRRSAAGSTAVALVLTLVAACSSHPAASAAPPKPSAVGAPAGDGVTATIGAAGGTVNAGDQGISVTVPAGALSADTAIGVQPIANTAAGGIGAAYRLTPAGQKFAQPVRISFPYTDADLAAAPPDAQGIAFQDAAGRWEWQPATLDPATKRMSVSTDHFTDWSRVPGVQLRPPKASVKPNGRVALTATVCVSNDTGDVVYLRFECVDSSDELAPLVKVNAATWAVNGAPGGTTGIGLVKGTKTAATYTAPAKRPPGGIVAVSVQVAYKGRKAVTISANVTIVGGYHVVGTFTETKTPLVCAGTVSAKISDRMEFSVDLNGDDAYAVTGIKNSKAVYAAPQVPGGYLSARVTQPPDIFLATDGAVEVGGAPDLLTVVLNGITVLGVCSFGGPVVSTGQTSKDRTGLAFYTTRFTGGTQTVRQDTGFRPWTFVVTEK